jgi:type II secretory pathway component GspD/PulD (secretin)
MISSNGRLTALTTTNRIEAMDAAINLRQVASLLEQERNQSSRNALAPEFRLRHIAAEKAKEMLEAFLGVEKKQNTPMTPQQMQMMQQMQQRSGGKPMPAPKKAEISIVADTRQNSIFIRAPVDRIAIATEFINRIDVPGQGLASLSDIESRVQVFRLASIDPEKLIEIIGEMNVLEPSTRLRADKTNQALIVSGSAADRYIIDRLIKRLDGSGREFEVLQLRRLDATEVAESISFLMGKEKDDDSNSSSRRYSYYGYGYGRGEEEEKNEDEFRVAANSRFRQVLLWANESEMEQVRNLLIKLGELPPPGGSTRTIRRIDATSGPETYDYLMRLKQQWSQISDAPLELPDSTEFIDPVSRDVDEETTDSEETEEQAKPNLEENLETTNVAPVALDGETENTAEAVGVTGGSVLATTQNDATIQNRSSRSDQPSGETDSSIRSARDFDRLFGAGPKSPAANETADDGGRSDVEKDQSPIKIQLDEDGNLLLLGSNTKALDRLENLMLQVAPPKRPYHVFKIKHQSAGYVRLNLVEYFEDTEEEDSSGSSFYRYLFDMDQSSDDGPTGLGKDNELRFVYDPDTNTIVVTGASSSQLRTISELIELWDVAEPVNKRSMRYTKLVEIEFARAEKIAETVKEAYRDLLSSNDKTFAGGKGGGGGGGGGAPGNDGKSSGREKQGSGLVDSENGRDGGDVDFSFKGKLSMGVDTIGNTLLVSAEGEPLLDLVVEMIHKLDNASKPAGDMQIISLSGNTSEDSIKNILKAFGGGSSNGSSGGSSGGSRDGSGGNATPGRERRGRPR